MAGANDGTRRSVPANGSDCGTGCRALGLRMFVLLLLTLRLLLGRCLLLGSRCLRVGSGHYRTRDGQ